MTPYDDQKQIELRSDEVQEILGTPPFWLVRWGTTVVLIAFAVLLLVGWMVRYPDVIPATIVLTTANPPVEVVARTDGRITELLVQDTQMVEKDQVLAVLSNTARFDHVRQVDRLVSGWLAMPVDSLTDIAAPSGLELGEIQGDYSVFVQNLETLRFGKDVKSQSLSTNIASVGEQIRRLQEGIQLDQRARQRAVKNLENLRELFGAQEDLYRQGVVSKMELERERQKVGDAEEAVDRIDESMLRKQNEIASLRKSINETSAGELEAGAGQSVRLRESLTALRAGIDRWKQTYLLVAPVGGKVSLNAAYFSAQQYVKQGERVMTIVPLTTTKIFGRLSLPIAGSGKVKTGQRVVVKLESYPFHEFGVLEGAVGAKALVPNDTMYNIIVLFPPGLRTNYGKTIPFEQQLRGSAEIVTEDKRFLERILEQVFAAGH